MTEPSPVQTDSSKSSSSQVTGLSEASAAEASHLAEEMARQWAEGLRPSADELIENHPVLRHNPEAAIRIIYEEYCLRQEHGLDGQSAEIVNRFPEWQSQLEVLLACHRLLGRQAGRCRFPEAGQYWKSFHLLKLLGSGAQGRVFLATQGDLADRPVVLKFTPDDGAEHLTLARLQHTNIVPLFGAEHDRDQNLRAICMPYFGGLTLAQALQAFGADKQAPVKNRNLLCALQEANQLAPCHLTVSPSPARLLGRLSYTQALCWMGFRLAEALQYAHDRSFVHLDIKPSNILIAADGQPMLLDFHLAREPLKAGDAGPTWLGGTPQYMSPEHQHAFLAISQGKSLAQAVDARSDIYSLGIVLFEAFSGGLPPPTNIAAYLQERNQDVSPGLADIIARCLATDAARRYPTAAALASDLGRHLQNLPLRGVPNRSWTERWHKWRCRRPYALASWLMLSIVAALALAGSGISLGYVREKSREADSALTLGRRLLNEGRFAEAVDALNRAAGLQDSLWNSASQRVDIQKMLDKAEQCQARQSLHLLADQLRLVYGMDPILPARARPLLAASAATWHRRQLVLDSLAGGSPEFRQTRQDLLDLAVLWSDMRSRLASRDHNRQELVESLKVLMEAEQFLGGSIVLSQERESIAQKILPRVEALSPASNQTAQTAWEHYALGRSLLNEDKLDAAATEFNRALALQPEDFWFNYYQGICAYRLGRHGDAIASFRVCIALKPNWAECYYNRALALTAGGQEQLGFEDYNRALAISPDFGLAALNRAVLNFRAGNYAGALRDLDLAATGNADLVAVQCNRAIVFNALKDRAAALACLEEALRHDPGNRQVLELRARLNPKP
jgi:serine/threonine protein kinase/Flp pilus assembly protein TadD